MQTPYEESMMPTLTERQKQVRRDLIKLSIENGGYHFGGSLSVTDILIALYDHVMTKDDKVILSKGHSCWPLYVLLREKGLDPKLLGHPTLDEANGVFASTGSLGHGMPLGLGMAWAKKMQKQPGKIYVIVGDGECQEGTTWESILTASHHEIGNLTVIIDKNDIQGSGRTGQILSINCIAECADSAGWEVAELNGHSVPTLAIEMLTPQRPGQPKLIIANTHKGYPISFMMDDPAWHAKWPNPEELALAYKELA